MLKGLVSFVTGAASGLGKQTAQYLASKGGRVALVDLPESEGHQVAESIGNNALYLPCDVRNEEDVKNALELCTAEFGRLDLAVNCAGLSRAFKIANPFGETVFGIDEFHTTYQAVVHGTFNVARLAAPLMFKNEPTEGQRGIIINTGGLSADDGFVGQSVIAASKAAVVAMTLPLSREFASLGIRVVTISPGIFESPLTSEDCMSDVVREYFTEQMLLPKRFGNPLEFAQMVESVVCNRMLNGVNIKLSAGLRFNVQISEPVEDNPKRFGKLDDREDNP